MEQFLVTTYQRAMDEDCLGTTGPMRKNVNNTDDISDIYDVIVYEKGTTTILYEKRQFLTCTNNISC